MHNLFLLYETLSHNQYFISNFAIVKILKKYKYLNKLPQFISGVGGVFILLVFFLQFAHQFGGDFFQSSEHNHNHSHSHVTHTAIDELNACHRLIYHNDYKEGCSHDSHIVEDETSCKFCDMESFSGDYFVLNKTGIKQAVLETSLFWFSSTNIEPISILPQSRGPPFLG